jgi:DNA-binding transcriptional MerR regulator
MNRYTIADAARALGVTQQAIHGRINRGTIPTERGENGKQYVFLTDDEIQEQREQRVINPGTNGLMNDYITALKSEIESLKADRELWQEEARRKDTIIAQMNQSLASLINRVPELEASPEATESPVTASETQGRGEVPADAQNRSWWRRIFAPDV